MAYEINALHHEQLTGTLDNTDEIKGNLASAYGTPGVDGITPHIGENGNWWIGDVDTGKPSRGVPGEDGLQGEKGEPGYTPIKGVDYFDGNDGKDAISPVVSVSAITGGHRITITDANGTKTIDVLNGSDGKDGQNGIDGISSWNDLTDKPFGETTVNGDTLTWDGNSEGLESFDVGDVTTYLVSNAIITYDDIKNGYAIVTSDGETYESDAEATKFIWEMIGFMYGPSFAIVPTDNFIVADLNVTFPKAGVYFWDDGEIYCASLTIPGYTGFESTTVKTIDEKYLPDSVATKDYIDNLLGVIENGTY